jgi:uncharacterized RDD family membrane protein YckC
VSEEAAEIPRAARRAARAEGIPLEALAFQGERAGIVSRVIANSIDFAVVVGALVSLYVGWSAALFLWSPTSFTLPPVRLGVAVFAFLAFLFLYFWATWATTGRTYGDLVMGLRVVNWRGERMHWTGAAVRAAFCTAFAIGLFWVVVSGANRSVQDVVLRTSVIYDWGRRRPAPQPPGPPGPPGPGRRAGH